MILQNTYYYWQEALDKETCEKIISLGLGKVPEEGLVHRKENKSQDEGSMAALDQRRSMVSWLDEPWLYELLQPYIHTANREANWNFEWDFTEMLQFTVYEEGQHYNWHPDQNSHPYQHDDGQDFEGKIRKISASIILNDPSEYEGGELEFDLGRINGEPASETCDQLTKQGSIVVFPSFVYHRVKPVTKGTRYSLVMWNIGYPYK
jgi:PKHD-type hydroxylase